MALTRTRTCLDMLYHCVQHIFTIIQDAPVTVLYTHSVCLFYYACVGLPYLLPLILYLPHSSQCGTIHYALGSLNPRKAHH